MNSLLKILILLFLSTIVFAQSNEEKIIVDEHFNLREIAAKEFGDANLWPYILKYNRYELNASPQKGSSLIIPTKKVKDALSKLSEAEQSVKNAIEIGAKVLAEEQINSAINNLNNAYKLKKEFEIDKLFNISLEIIKEANAAFKKTKEIREKTVDAILSYKIGTVQKLFPSSIRWNNIELMENLRENDWARTLSTSLAKITFYDLNQIRLNENSQAIIQHSKFDPLLNKASTKVKIEKGDAYAMLVNSPKKKFDLDIKGVKTKINSKYFWVEKNNNSAKFANYNGEIEISAKDSIVSIKKNQGSVIPENGLPSPAKNLLPAPNLITPNPTEKFSNTSIDFTWSKIDGASNYWLEIGLDENFKNVFLQQKSIKGNSFTVDNISEGIKYWRVCAVDELGLPGPFSDVRRFVIVKDNSLPFLLVEKPQNNFITKEQYITLYGKSDIECNILINNSKVINNNGFFEHKLNLSNGWNRILIEAVNKSNKKNHVTLNVYYESSPIVELFYNEKKVENELSILTNQGIMKLDFQTRPFTVVHLFDDTGKKEQVSYADSTGNFFLHVNLNKNLEKKSLELFSKAGYKRKIDLQLEKDNEPPRIILENDLPSFTNKNKVEITGVVSDADDIFINGNKLILTNNGKFKYQLELLNRNNELKIEAKDKAGNISVVTKNIFFDDQPPIYIETKIYKIDFKTNIYSIDIFAKDETKLNNFAKAELSIGSKILTEILSYGKIKKCYSTKILNTSSEAPKIISITLEDAAQNIKTYKLN